MPLNSNWLRSHCVLVAISVAIPIENHSFPWRYARRVDNLIPDDADQNTELVTTYLRRRRQVHVLEENVCRIIFGLELPQPRRLGPKQPARLHQGSIRRVLGAYVLVIRN